MPFKLGFSTLGCPEWSIEQVIRIAQEANVDGIELRMLKGELYLPKLPEFSEGNIEHTKRKITDAGLCISCVSSSARMGVVEDMEATRQMQEAQEFIRLANGLGAKVVRVFGGDPPKGVSMEDHIARVADRLMQLGEFASNYGVVVAVETHDAFTKCADIAKLLSRVASEHVGVLWDFHHSYRSGETMQQSVELVGKRIVATHVKDSRIVDGKVRYVKVGEGDVPIYEAIKALASVGYDGFLTLEWEKAWHKELEPLTEVLPHYSATMRRMIEQLGLI
ncbi:MAG: sugar phosphate isomerase/epimerase family protein [Armatimonadota bacterium]|nr:sugar phosphate isomerase/epimerase [Armatimonadota bacterium]MCX7777437.1 sugar phosphate isomerase/epimerase [Armatimonadota bacterium]MDW8025106.1 sugar phosphate isomerase/epimerase family protein [Armatimonadota bacterium]